ncbi:hypothetical protein L916_17615, partial [Phytophthora nicotianae]
RLSIFLVLVVGFVAGCFNLTDAEEQVKITLLDDVVDDFTTKMKENSVKLKGGTSATTSGDVKLKEAAKVAASSTMNLNDAIVKLEPGAKQKPLDTTSGKWKGNFDKLKAEGQLKNGDEKHIAKPTEEVA